LSLYIPAIDVHKVVWGGAGSTKPEAEQKYDVDSVRYVTQLKADVKKWWNHGAGKLYLLHPDQTVAPYFSNGKLDVGRIDASSLQFAADHCRVIKDDHEIKLIRRANQVSADAHRAVLANIRSFKNESQVAAIFLDTSMSEGAKKQSYNIIAGSGVNAAVLHYVNNDEPLEDRQVLLLDAGAEWQCYASDVTRTFPISGHWSTEAKNIYDLVDDMQTQCIERFRPGASFRDLYLLAHFIAVTGLLRLGILHNGTREEILKAGTSVAFLPHGLGVSKLGTKRCHPNTGPNSSNEMPDKPTTSHSIHSRALECSALQAIRILSVCRGKCVWLQSINVTKFGSYVVLCV
jgi:Xaa-Pro dipeptidase